MPLARECQRRIMGHGHPLPGLGFPSAVTQKHAPSGMITGMDAMSSAAPPAGGTQIPGTPGKLPMEPRPANMQQHPPTRVARFREVLHQAVTSADSAGEAHQRVPA